MKIDVTCIAMLLYTTATVYSKSTKRRTLLSRLSENGRLHFPGLAAKYGFSSQQENVTTEDGYILALFHIPGNASRPVLLIHGNTPTADCWITRGDSSLAITLARRGYDVWAINLRGTRYSRKHVYLDPDNQPNKFFNYSFYEQAIYDMPATIDFILQKTGQTELIAIGHSVGTTMLYVLGAERPEYNDKIKLGISLAPISFLQNVRGLASVAIALGPTLIELVSVLNIHEFVSHEQFAPLFQTICLEPLFKDICMSVISFSLGDDTKGFEPEFLRTFFGHYPGGTTKKILEHLIQVSRSNRFARFDYGPVRNMRVYHSVEPVKFNLSKVTMRSAIFVGKEDFLATVEDAELLKAALPNVVYYQVLPYENFNHADFIWGRYMADNFYPYLFGLLEKYI